jgi:penicillin V acylase-like amidase (Ntn superfamily)
MTNCLAHVNGWRQYSLHSPRYLLLALLIVLISPSSGLACSVFCIDRDNQLVVGRSYDWSFGEGMVVVNKRHQLKTAFRYWSESASGLAQWTSKYGSITFVQYGREIAFDGMNEAGLTVHELWLEQSRYPAPDARPSMSVDQFVQYILDNYSRVDEITETDALVRLRPTDNDFTHIHFVAFDSKGDSLCIDVLNGKMVYHLRETMPVKAITNNTYEESLAYFNQGHAPSPGDGSSLARFYRIADMAAQYDNKLHGDPVLYAFQILDAVKAGTWTKFQTVFDIRSRRIYFKSLANSALRYFDFDRFDFSCTTPSKALDVNAQLSGDTTEAFTDYTTARNEALIRAAWIGLGNTNIYQPALELMSRYPETFICRSVALPDPNGPIQNLRTLQHFSSIQSAVFYAMSQDVIQLRPGVYRESIDLSNKDVTLRSVDPNNPLYVGGTIVQGDSDKPVVTLTNNSPACTLAGLTLRAGSVGISGTAAHATIRCCRIMDHAVNGLELWNESHPHLLHCLVTGNGTAGIVMHPAGGRRSGYCRPTIEDCVIVQNGQKAIDGGEPNIIDSIVQD